MGDDTIVYIVQMSIGQTGSYRQVSDQVAPRETVFYVISVVSVN